MAELGIQKFIPYTRRHHVTAPFPPLFFESILVRSKPFLFDPTSFSVMFCSARVRYTNLFSAFAMRTLYLFQRVRSHDTNYKYTPSSSPLVSQIEAPLVVHVQHRLIPERTDALVHDGVAALQAQDAGDVPGIILES